MNLYILGDLRGAYRIKELLKIMLRQEYIHLYINDLRNNKINDKICKKIAAVFAMISSDIIYVAPCQHDSILLKIATLFNKKIITDFYISFYDTEVNDRKNCKPKSAIAKKWKKIDIFALKNSTKLIFLNKSEAEYYTSLLGIDLLSLNYDLIPLCVPYKKTAILPYFQHERDYIHFCWCGTYIPLQSLDKIIHASFIAISQGLKMHLTIWGDSEVKAAQFAKLVTLYKIENFVTIVNDKWGDIDAWTSFIIQECDVTFGIFGDSMKAKSVIANKVIDGIAFRTPVLTGQSRGICEFFDVNDLFICENDAESIAKKMMLIAKTPFEEISKIIDRSYQKYLNIFSPKCFERQIIKCFDSLK